MNKQSLRDALRKAFNMGQTYWQQADSEYTKDWKKADITAEKFRVFVEEICEGVEE